MTGIEKINLNIDEMKSTYTKNVLIRVKRREYFISKYIAQFVTGAVVIMIPLSISIILTLRTELA